MYTTNLSNRFCFCLESLSSFLVGPMGMQIGPDGPFSPGRR